MALQTSIPSRHNVGEPLPSAPADLGFHRRVSRLDPPERLFNLDLPPREGDPGRRGGGKEGRRFYRTRLLFRGGSPHRSQKLMRMRVLLQFLAIIVIMLTIWAIR